MVHGKNDNSDELKRERRNLLSRIKRRETAILFARADIRDFNARLAVIESQIAERKDAS